MFDAYCLFVYCLFIYFLFIYFLCCKYRPFFPIFFYIIPTKICKILFFFRIPLFPPSFLPLSSLFPSSFLLFFLPPFVLSFSPFVSRELGSVQLGCIAFPSFPLLQTKSLQASSTFRCAYRLLSYIYIRNSDCYPFFIFQPFLYFKLNLCDCSICLGSSASSSSSLVMRPCSITIS